uniref:Secreted protein n=1 Tax=Panagrellus redivivus TaxID=6233 RepID=A0A7E4VTT4_PANRE
MVVKALPASVLCRFPRIVALSNRRKAHPNAKFKDTATSMDADQPQGHCHYSVSSPHESPKDVSMQIRFSQSSKQIHRDRIARRVLQKARMTA